MSQAFNESLCLPWPADGAAPLVGHAEATKTDEAAFRAVLGLPVEYGDTQYHAARVDLALEAERLRIRAEQVQSIAEANRVSRALYCIWLNLRGGYRAESQSMAINAKTRAMIAYDRSLQGRAV